MFPRKQCINVVNQTGAENLGKENHEMGQNEWELDDEEPEKADHKDQGLHDLMLQGNHVCDEGEGISSDSRRVEHTRFSSLTVQSVNSNFNYLSIKGISLKL